MKGSEILTPSKAISTANLLLAMAVAPHHSERKNDTYLALDLIMYNPSSVATVLSTSEIQR